MPRRSRSRSQSSHQRSSTPGATRIQNQFPPSHQVFVTKFSHRTRESDLQRAFEKFGRIENIDLKKRGCYAFIIYSDARSALNAIQQMHGRTLPNDEQRLVVEQAAGSKRKNSRRSRSRDVLNRSRRADNSDNLCYNCNKSGHWAVDCKEVVKTSRKVLNESRCFTCGQKGHKKFDCVQDSGSNRQDRDRVENYRQKRFTQQQSKRRYSSSRSRSPPPKRTYITVKRDQRGKRQTRSVSNSRSSSYEKDKYRQTGNRQIPLDRRSVSPVTRRSRGGQRDSADRQYSRAKKRDFDRRKRLSSRSVSQASKRSEKIIDRLTNIEEINTAITTTKFV